MNRILSTLLIACVFSLPAGAKRSTGGSKEATRENVTSASGAAEATTLPAIQTIPAPTYRTPPPSPTASTPFTAPATTRTYTPSTPSYRGESFKGRSEPSQPQQTSQRQATRVPNPTESTAPAQERTSISTPSGSTPASATSARREESPSAYSARERKGSLREPTRPETAQQDVTPTVRTKRTRQENETTPTTVRSDANPETTPLRSVERLQKERTARSEQPQRVQITPPSRTASRTAEKGSSPFIFNERSSPQPAPAQRVTSTRHDRPQYDLNAQRRPEPVRSTYHPPDTHNYHSRHYPNHYYTHRPVTCYSGREAFWSAFSFTLAAPFIAPLSFAQVVHPFPVRTVTTTWHSGNVAVSVSSYPAYPVTTYRPYYCSSAWYHHDGWQHSYAYYGGWRGNWYGGFSYMFNPYPVYRTYYLYEEPQTIVIQQPAPQVVIVNQPSQPAVVQGQDFSAAPAPATPQPSVQTAASTNQPERCYCACKCNGRVPCICEYACGSEFNYTPEAYTLADFVSYAESLNAELIWSSYAGLDRSEATDYVTEATEQ